MCCPRLPIAVPAKFRDQADSLESFSLTNDHADRCANCEKLISRSISQLAAPAQKLRARRNVPTLAESYNHPMKGKLALSVEHKSAGRSRLLPGGPTRWPEHTSFQLIPLRWWGNTHTSFQPCPPWRIKEISNGKILRGNIGTQVTTASCSEGRL